MAAVAEDVVADDADGAWDGQFDIGVATAEGTLCDLFYAIRNLIAWLAEFYAGEEEFLTVFAVGNMMLVEGEIIIVYFIIGEAAVVECGPLFISYLRSRFENLSMVNHTIRYIELSETGTILKGSGRHKQSAFLDSVLREMARITASM